MTGSIFLTSTLAEHKVALLKKPSTFTPQRFISIKDANFTYGPLPRPRLVDYTPQTLRQHKAEPLGPRAGCSNSDKPNMTAVDRQPDHIEGMRCKAPKRRTPQREWTSKLEPVPFSRHTHRCGKQQSWMASASS